MPRATAGYGRGVHLTEATWPDAEGRPVLCIPVGSCEQHGPHLPLATDTIIAEALAAGLAGRLPRALVGPSLTVTASGRCGPCCSHEPTGMHSTGRSSASGHVASVRCTPRP